MKSTENSSSGVNSVISGKACPSLAFTFHMDGEVAILYSAVLLEIHWNVRVGLLRVLLPEASRKGCGTNTGLEVNNNPCLHQEQNHQGS